VIKRRFIFNTIRRVFEQYGYLPIETPAMEDLKTLTGKYGEEGDRLLFKVLNNGDFLAKADQSALDSKDSQGVIPSISKRGLRYDLTVPFARYVVMHQNDLNFPFKRYQIQPVWRADRPQKGRYQEFYQCDVDVVGSTSLMYEAELLHIYDQAFSRLGVKVVIQINNRKVLYGLAEAAGIVDNFVDMTTAIDKLDKIGTDKVIEEMTKKGISDEAARRVMNLLKIDSLDELAVAFAGSPTGLLGIQELRNVHAYIDDSGLHNKLVWDITLARGLNYYTGCIMEVKADVEAYPDLVMGSIGGGGRYDNLTEVFGMKDMSGVGISFGAARIYDVMVEENLWPEDLPIVPPVIVMGMDEESHRYGFGIAQKIRASGINCDMYPEAAKFKKQMKYANAQHYPHAIIIGEQERDSGLLTFKTMASGDQEKLDIDAIITRLRHD
jgi:histidyl-tRNA synthetase